MRSEESKRSILVGLFVFFAIVLFVAGIFVLGGQQKRFESTVHLKTVFDDVGGLRKGNNVWFSGVKVGTVKDIDFYGKSQVEITMRVEEDVQKYIRKDAKVRISSEGFIGNKILVIEGGSPDSPVVEYNDRLQSVAPFNTEDMMATLQENNKNLVAITSNFKLITSQMAQGQGTVGALLQDTSMAANFKDVVANLERVSINTVRASAALTQFTSKLNSQDGLANQLLTDTLVFQQLKSSVAQLQQTSTNAAVLTENLNDASKQLNTNNNSIGVLLNDQQFSAQLKNTMGNLESSSVKLDENLEALQHNFLFRRYFRKKGKDDAKGDASKKDEIKTEANASKKQ